MNIRRFRSSDVDFAAECARAEGWRYETRGEFESFLARDAEGCLVAEEGDQRIGVCVAVAYSSVGFIGELMVRSAWRGRGMGARLFSEAVQYLKGRGCEGIYLDAVPLAVPLYERMGFRRLCPSLRFAGRAAPRKAPRVREASSLDLPGMAELDRRAFGEDRSFFLRRRWARFPRQSLIIEDGAGVAGFATGREGTDGSFCVGPLVTRGGEAAAAALLEAISQASGGAELSLGVLSSHEKVVYLLKSMGFREAEAPPWRMVWGRDSGLGFSEFSYVIGSAAKG